MPQADQSVATCLELPILAITCTYLRSVTRTMTPASLRRQARCEPRSDAAGWL